MRCTAPRRRGATALKSERVIQSMLLSAEDIAHTIAAIHAASWKVAYRGLYADHYLDREVDKERRQYWGTRVPELIAGDGEIFLAQIGGQAAGFLCIELSADREWGAYVDNLHVLPAWRGANLGGALLEHGAAWAKARGQKQLWLWVFERNHAARRFYQRDGWRAVERQLDDVPGGGRRYVLRMVKSI